MAVLLSLKRDFGVLGAVDANNGVFTVGRTDRHAEVLLVDLELQWYFGELLEGLNEDLGSESYGACALSIFYLEASTDSGFAIRSCQRQLVALQAEQNIIQDRKTVLAANHTADCLQLVEQPCTRYLKFHTCIIYLICFHFLHLLFPLTVHFLIS